MNLKLVEYKERKFEKFLKLGKDFVYGGDFIEIKTFLKEGYMEGGYEVVTGARPITEKYSKDETDPLNRFDGLFDGRTYGEGRFVLVLDDQDSVKEPDYVAFSGKSWEPESFSGKIKKGKLIGNLHENPELYDKIKD